MNRRDALKTIGSLGSLATVSRILPGCSDDELRYDSVQAADTLETAHVHFEHVSTDTTWGTAWTHVVPGRWTSSPYDGLLLYSQASGLGAFYNTDGTGRRAGAAIRSYPGWRRSWTHMVSGFFRTTQYSDILMYDRSAGLVEVYGTDGAANIQFLMSSPTRPTWTHVVPAWFIEPNDDGAPNARPAGHFTSVLFYDATDGAAEVWASNGTTLSVVAGYFAWRTTWTHIVAGNFGKHGRSSDIFFYEGSTGYGELYSCEPNGSVKYESSFSGLPVNASAVVAGNFASGSGVADLVFLNGSGVPAGTLTFKRLLARDPNVPSSVDALATFATLGPEVTGISASTTLVAAANFCMDDTEDALFEWGPILPSPSGTSQGVDEERKQSLRAWRGSQGAFRDVLAYNKAAGSVDCVRFEPKQLIRALEGYARSTSSHAGQPAVSSGSVLPGETVYFHVSSTVGKYKIDIHQCGVAEGVSAQPVPLAQLAVPKGTPTPLPRTRLAYKDGPGWTSVANWKVPAGTKSGVYFARVTALSGTTAPIDIPFVVRSATPGVQNKILVVIPDATYEAYNAWGGRSTYAYLVEDDYKWCAPGPAPAGYYAPYGFVVSFRRPYFFPIEPRRWLHREGPLVRWLEQQQLGADYCTCRDLDLAVPASGYKVVVFPGHHEYWSRGMRQNLDSFTYAGGNAVFLSGNTCWFQVRFDYANDRMICYKVRDFDPAYRTANPGVTSTNWHIHPINWPSTWTTGVHWAGGFAETLPPAERQYTISSDKRSNPAFAKLEQLLASGDRFGTYNNGTQSVVPGSETDVCTSDVETDFRFNCRVGPISGPISFEPLAGINEPGCDPTNPRPVDMCTFGSFSPTGANKVLSVSAYNWCLGLVQPELPTGFTTPVQRQWSAIDQITSNILIQLTGKTNVATGGSILASSSYPYDGWGPQNLLDGNAGTGWSSQVGQIDPTAYDPMNTESIEIHLPGIRSFSKIIMYPRRDSPGNGFPINFSIWVWNGAQWIQRLLKTNYPNPGSAPQVFTWNLTDATDAIKIVGEKLMPVGNDGYLFQLMEVEVY